MAKSNNRYQQLIEKIFFDQYKSNNDEICFEREDLEHAAKALKIKLPKNLGDVIYAIRYRLNMPDSILKTQPEGMEWIIEGAGRAKYIIKLVKINRILPNPELITIKIPDSTPEIVSEYSLSDEQALLAKVRYNRLIDIFLGLTTYSLQNHLRTTVKDVGQIEIDEIYVGVDQAGCHYVIPVQAKGGNDQLSVVQTKQDILCCTEKYPNLVTRAISTQFMEDDLIAIFELTVQDEQVKLVTEKHYRLVPSAEISPKDLNLYRSASNKGI
ncbi:MAG: endonuclease [Endozoicomonadaceae bacterium]|nr:endonuclease [Endozoicomonadaceae bacterium]